MKITDGEKIILLMLSELYDKLGVEGEVEPDFIRSAIFSNNTWSIPWKYVGIPFEEQETPEVVKEVLDILDMWSMIERSYENLSNESKVFVEKEASPFGKDPKFPGFDGNNETEYMGTASFLVNDLDRFEEFKGRDFNSHCPSIDSYRRMLSVFKPLLKNLNFQPLSAQNIVDILKERVHPDNR
ncbi:YfbU family protein [Vreelandella titanicae]|uniref:YfbU family protein n=1 Tax=Vreelandella titanicae TaxID=664683 RepID=UPI0038148CC2|tara:strand:+ start:3281 stop:3832 length:552 start_codon:yes stop_codon:yes gene_type:complete